MLGNENSEIIVLMYDKRKFFCKFVRNLKKIPLYILAFVE